MKALRNIILILGGCVSTSGSSVEENTQHLEKDMGVPDISFSPDIPIERDLSVKDLEFTTSDVYTKKEVITPDSGIIQRDASIPRSGTLTARLDCEEIDSDGACVYRFRTYELHCWDGSASESGHGGRITDYILTSGIPGIDDLYGSSRAPVLCGVAIEPGTYDAYFEIWDESGDDDYVLTRNEIEDSDYY